MRLIGIAGKARSGKDQFSEILCKTYKFKRLSFGDKVKELGMKYFGLTYDQCYDRKIKDSRRILQGIGVTVRNHLDTVAEALNSEPIVGVSKYPTWVEKIAIDEFQVEIADITSRRKYVKAVFKGITEMFTAELENFIKVSNGNQEDIWINCMLLKANETDIFVIPDVRFTNEYGMINEKQGKNVKIIRLDKPIIETGAGHSSETNLDNETEWDLEIINTSKSDWLQRMVQTASNFVRKLKSEGFVTVIDEEQFMINVGK